MEPAIQAGSSTNRIIKLGLTSGMLSIAAGILLTFLRLDSVAELFTLPGFSWLMLAPIGLAVFTIGTAIVAVVRDQPVKRAAGLFGLGLLGVATPFVISLLLVALLVGIVVVALAQG